MADQSFSEREGLRKATPLIYDDAPHQLRYGVREVLTRLDYRTAFAQRGILCSALRTPPDTENWRGQDEDNEVINLLVKTPWLEFFDALERIPLYVDDAEVELYYDEMNALLADESIGYRFESGELVRVGTEQFHSAVMRLETPYWAADSPNLAASLSKPTISETAFPPTGLMPSKKL